MIEIDGSYLEGGGQIIRTAIALSAITKKPIRIINIRAKRKPPGLKPQHLTGVKAVAKICNAKLSDVKLGSLELEFKPGDITGGNYEFDIGTAGSVTLLLQSLIPVCVFSDKQFSINVIGGTNVPWSPPVEYFQHVFCDYLLKMNAKIKFEIKKYGFYPKGGGRVKIRVNPSKLNSINIVERGRLVETCIHSIASKDLEQAKVAQRQASAFKKNFIDTEYCKDNITYVNTLSPGSSLHAHANFENCKLGVEVLGERGKPSEKIGRECALKLKQEIDSNSTVDIHMGDQIIPYIGILGGSVRVREITKHTETNIWITEKFLGKRFKVENGIISNFK